jgi:hypothetical protein
MASEMLTITVKLRVLLRRTLPQPRLVIFTFTPLLTLPVILLKKINHPYPFRFLLPCRSTLRLPRLGRGHTLPSLLPHTQSAVTLSHLVMRASGPLPSCALVLVVLALLVACTACPADPSLELVAWVLACTGVGG